MTRKDQLRNILADLCRRAPETVSAIVATRDGFSVASGLPETTDREDDTIAAATARILDVANDISQQLDQGHLGRILIEGEQRTTIVTGAGRDTALAVVVPAEAPLGRVMSAIRYAAKKVQEVYG
ncbi:MAG: roadblock/LC7 domain-containing protein [Anaerolineae bacterium]